MTLVLKIKQENDNKKVKSASSTFLSFKICSFYVFKLFLPFFVWKFVIILMGFWLTLPLGLKNVVIFYLGHTVG